MSRRGLDRNSSHCRQLRTRDSMLKGAVLRSQGAAVLEMGLPRLVKVMGKLEIWRKGTLRQNPS